MSLDIDSKSFGDDKNLKDIIMLLKKIENSSLGNGITGIEFNIKSKDGNKIELK